MNHEDLISSLRATVRELELNQSRTDEVGLMNTVLSKANNSLSERVKELESYSAGAAKTIDALWAKTIDALWAKIESREGSAELLIEEGLMSERMKLAAAEASLNDLVEQDEARGRAIDHYRELLKNSAERGDALEARVKELDGCLKNMREEHVRLMLESIRWKKEAADMKGNWELCIEACDLLKQRIYPQEKANYILKMNMQAAQNTVRDLQTATEAKELALAAQVAENSRLIGVITRLRQKLSEYWIADREDLRPATPGQATFLAGFVKQTEAGC